MPPISTNSGRDSFSPIPMNLTLGRMNEEMISTANAATIRIVVYAIARPSVFASLFFSVFFSFIPITPYLAHELLLPQQHVAYEIHLSVSCASWFHNEVLFQEPHMVLNRLVVKVCGKRQLPHVHRLLFEKREKLDSCRAALGAFQKPEEQPLGLFHGFTFLLLEVGSYSILRLLLQFYTLSSRTGVSHIL